MGWDQAPRPRRRLKPSSEEKKQYARDIRAQKAAFIERYKMERGCRDCGLVPDYAMVLSFDHLPEHEKEFQLSKATSYSMERIRAEIEKCEVVCLNCHAARTASRLAA